MVSVGGEPAAKPAKRSREVGNVELQGLDAYYGSNHAVRDVSLAFDSAKVTAIIGPSGCGKSTMVRCINRMHEEIPGAHAEGRVLLDGLDVYDSSVDVVAVRRAIGAPSTVVSAAVSCGWFSWSTLVTGSVAWGLIRVGSSALRVGRTRSARGSSAQA